MLSRFHLIPERNRQTDGRTDLLYQYARQYAGERRGENWREVGKFVGKYGEWLVEDVRKMWRERWGKL